MNAPADHLLLAHDRYEYKVDTVTKVMLTPGSYGNDQLQADLNRGGAEGWELVTFSAIPTPGQMHVNFVWKRKIKETRQ